VELITYSVLQVSLVSLDFAVLQPQLNLLALELFVVELPIYFVLLD